MTGHRFGEDATNGLLLEARAHITRRLTERVRLGVSYFGDFNDTSNIGSFSEQEHQLGPILKLDLGGGFDLKARALFGISESASDDEFSLGLIFFY